MANRKRNTVMSADRPAILPATTSNGNTGRGQTLADIPQNQACKYVASEGVCERYGAHIQNNDYSAANQEIQNFANQENITFQQANVLIQVCCGYRGTTNWGKCDEDLWVGMPDGTASGPGLWWGKADYCQRCAVDNNNPTGLASDGNLPVFLTPGAPYWNPSPNGKNYCHCCEDDTSGDYTCEIFQQLTQQQRDGYCQKWQQAQGDPLAMTSEVSNLAIALGISNSYAEWVFKNCCNPCPEASPNSPFYTYPQFCDSDWCKDGQGNWLSPGHPDCVCCPGYTSISTDPCPPQDSNSPYYTNQGEFCPQCQPGGYYHGINHPDCQCCPTTTTTTTTDRYRCDAGGCLQCPSGAPASACPYTEPKCGNACGGGNPFNTQSKRYMNMSGTKTNHWVPLLVLGASLMIGLYISEYATKKLIK